MSREERRSERRQEIISVTRQLFDERGVREAQIEDIAREVGINRAIIYRHFSTKEELFAVVLLGYLAELTPLLAAEADQPSSALALDQMTRAFLDYGRERPAFVDCAVALLRRPGPELTRDISQEVMIELAHAVETLMRVIIGLLERGDADREFHVADPALVANVLCTQGLGILNLSGLSETVRSFMPGAPDTADDEDFGRVKDYAVTSALAMARGAAVPQL